jgi:hypothetical protein
MVEDDIQRAIAEGFVLDQEVLPHAFGQGRIVDFKVILQPKVALPIRAMDRVGPDGHLSALAL